MEMMYLKIADTGDASTKTNTLAKRAPTFSGNAHLLLIPNLLKGISKTGCDNGPVVRGQSVISTIQYKKGVVSGSERWLMFANKQWKRK